MCLSLWAALYYDILDEKIRTQEIAPDFLLAWETKHFLCFLGNDFRLGGSQHGLAGTSLECCFAVLPLKQNPWEGPHSGAKVAWADPLVEALSLRAASTWLRHLGFCIGLRLQFRYHVPIAFGILDSVKVISVFLYMD
jgi:hypothetical protein